QTSNGTHAVDLPLNGLVNIPGLTNISARIAIVQPPRQKIFRAGEVLNPSDADDYASTAQARIELSATLNVAGLVGVNLPLYVTLAKATAGLEEVHCARAGQPQHIVDVDTTTSIATLGVGQYSDIEAPSPTVTTANLVNVSALGIPIATIQAATAVDLGEESADGLEFEGPYSKTQSLSTNLVSAVDNGLDDLSSGLTLTVSLLGINLPLVNEAAVAGAVIAPLTAALQPVLNLLNPTVVALLDALGVSVGNAEVEVVSLTPVNRNGSQDDPDSLSLQAFLFSH
ncbi:MAG TPA: hypothetical protein VJM11_03925, partial [Nevskiaceae bacterium]|nr:hypothetical protein [Nevskiaceae bacterium]